MEELSEKLLGSAVFKGIPEGEGSNKEQKTEEQKVSKTLSQLVSQIAAQRKKIEASPSKVALEKEMEETEALQGIAKAALELHTQLRKAAPDFEELKPALEPLMVELPQSHFDHTCSVDQMFACATFQMTYQEYAAYIGLFRVGVMEASFVSALDTWKMIDELDDMTCLFPGFSWRELGGTAYEVCGSKRIANGAANATKLDAQPLAQCAHRAGEKCIVDLPSRKAYAGFPRSVAKHCPDQCQLVERKHRSSCLSHPFAQDGTLD